MLIKTGNEPLGIRHVRAGPRSLRYQTSECPTTSELATELPAHSICTRTSTPAASLDPGHRPLAPGPVWAAAVCWRQERAAGEWGGRGAPALLRLRRPRAVRPPPVSAFFQRRFPPRGQLECMVYGSWLMLARVSDHSRARIAILMGPTLGALFL